MAIRRTISILLVLLLCVCQENEDPNIIYGDYTLVSIISSEAVDIANKGLVSKDLLTQLKSMVVQPTDIYYLTLYNHIFSYEFIFNLPKISEYPQGINIDSIYAIRKYIILPDGNITLDFITDDYFDNPYQLDINLVISRLWRDSNNKIITIEALQMWYDYSQGNWKEISVTYQFKKWGS